MKRNFSYVLLIATIIGTFYFIVQKIGGEYWYKLFKLPEVNKEESFTVVVLPDTQHYSSARPDIFCKQTQWIAENKEKLNIVFVTQLGDVVDNGADDLAQWKSAADCMSKLDGVVPYSLTPGNHDLNKISDKTSSFNMFESTFTDAQFRKYDWYGGSFEGYRNNYSKITTNNGYKILFMNLSVEPSNDVIAWAKDILNNNYDSFTILSTHKYLDVDSNYPEDKNNFGLNGNSGKEIWEKLVYPSCNVGLVLSGHFHGENRIFDKDMCGKRVNQVLQDYQDRENGGNGWLRIYIFTPNKDNIKVYTYSPFLDRLEVDSDSKFTLRLK